MDKFKIHEIAKKLGIASKDVIAKAEELGIEVKNHLSSVSEEEAKKIEEGLNPKMAEKKEKNQEENKANKKNQT